MALELTQQDFDAWFSAQILEHASETRRGERLCLILHVRTNTALVTHGDRVLYEGDILDAIATYNQECGEPRLSVQDFDTWLDNKSLEYASETRRDARLRLKLLPRTGAAIVTHGDRVLYNGTPDTAIATYNAA